MSRQPGLAELTKSELADKCALDLMGAIMGGLLAISSYLIVESILPTIITVFASGGLLIEYGRAYDEIVRRQENGSWLR